MIERYRKWGRAVRIERGVTVDVREAGEALEDRNRFVARPLDVAMELPPVADDVQAIATRIRGMVAPSVQIERLIVTAGIAEHEFGGERWRDTSVRIHVSLVQRERRLRAILDLGDHIDDIARVSNALSTAGDERDAPSSYVLAPHVAAALLPRLGVRLMQTARGRDGKGAEIREIPLARGDVFPNWYRPSYRVRPVRMPFHIRAVQTTTSIDPSLPRIVALLGVHDRAVDVLCADGDTVFQTMIHPRRVLAAGPPRAWYPHGAGAFGSELVL